MHNLRCGVFIHEETLPSDWLRAHWHCQNQLSSAQGKRNNLKLNSKMVWKSMQKDDTNHSQIGLKRVSSRIIFIQIVGMLLLFTAWRGKRCETFGYEVIKIAVELIIWRKTVFASNFDGTASTKRRTRNRLKNKTAQMFVITLNSNGNGNGNYNTSHPNPKCADISCCWNGFGGRENGEGGGVGLQMRLAR